MIDELYTEKEKNLGSSEEKSIQFEGRHKDVSAVPISGHYSNDQMTTNLVSNQENPRYSQPSSKNLEISILRVSF